MKVERVLPFRFLTAARYAPSLEPELERAMFRCMEGQEKLTGRTALLVDVSGSMDSVISAKSEVTRMDTACGLAILLREIADDVIILPFSQAICVVPPRRGMALRDAIVNSMPHGGTMTADALRTTKEKIPNLDRIILITDEQSYQTIDGPWTEKAYVINVGADKNGIGYGKWVHIDGWSEACVNWMLEYERGES
jgi:Mg-chelatase subunit ChlD